ncbi:MAG TPA: glutamate--tRNA ligase [Geobacterales bacterium]|nr:glutamate--tRNA ligase [Geobacterales bacterium]
MSQEIRDLLFRKSLSNAYKHEGKADLDAVIRKIIFLRPDLRPKIKEIIPIAKEIIAQVNSLSLDEQYNYLIAKYPEELKEEKIETKKFELPPLEGAEQGKVITRFAPNPDGPLHIGNIRAMLLSHEYARIYQGKFILRLEDTDPRTKKPILHIYNDEKRDYEYILRDLEWFEAYPDEIYIQSDRLKIYYDVARELFSKEALYVCFCSKEEISKKRVAGLQCEHRNRGIEENLRDFEALIQGSLIEQQPVVRIKTDLSHPDPSVRDWIAFRVIDPVKYPHPRISAIESYLGHKPYLWPTYNFASTIDDHLMGITHIFRAKEHMGNTVKQSFIYKAMNWIQPFTIHYGRIKFEGAVLSKSKIIDGIKKGIYEGFQDVDLATIMAFRMRGFLAKSIKQAILEMGAKPVEAKISFETLHAINRKIIDPIADRYFFVPNPVSVKLRLDQRVLIRRQLHPSRNDFFEFELSPKNGYVDIFLDSRDIQDNFEVRLIELGNFRITRRENFYEGILLGDQSLEYAREKKLRLIQWVSEDHSINAVVKVPSYIFGKKNIYGKVEDHVKNLKPNTFIQFVRNFFVKFHGIDNKDAIFYYLHD